MSSETEQAHNAYAQLIDHLAVTGPLTFLHIGAEQTQVMTGHMPDKTIVLPLALGHAQTATTFFHHLPPTPDEMELAIMTVEDEVTRIRHQVDNQRPLYVYDAAGAEIAEAVGAEPEAAGWPITQDDIERLFKRFEQVMYGRPASWEAIPLDNAFTARLLILREFMHHLGFLSVFIASPSDAVVSSTMPS